MEKCGWSEVWMASMYKETKQIKKMGEETGTGKHGGHMWHRENN